MRVPQVKEAQAKGLRAMFAGIGQLLSITDKLRGKSAAAPDPETVVPATAPSGTATQTATTKAPAPETATPETATPETATPEAALPETVAAETVAAETVTPETEAAGTATPETAATETVIPEVKTAAKPRAAAKPAAAKPAPDAPVAAESAAPGGHVRLIQPEEEAPAAPAAPAAAASAPTAELPLANYDELTIPSLRARLRNLSADQLGQLIEYEKSHADRPDVITMFERRVAKLAEG
jgi:hypothetical protein